MGRRLLGLGLAGMLLAGCTSAPAARTITDVTVVHAVDPSSVPGLTTETRTEQNDRRRLFAGYPRIPGADALTDELGAVVDEQTRSFQADARTGGNVPELNVEWSITAASKDVAGVRLVTDRFTGASGGETRQTFWYDGRAREVRPSTALVSDLDGLAEAVRGRLGTETNPAQVTSDVFSSIAFNEQGDMVVEFSDYTVAPGTAGRVAAALPRAVYEPLLSGFGRRARDAAVAAPGGLSLTSSSEVGAPPPRAIDCAKVKCVALTFDDGPGPYTGRLLESLAEKGARATFFVVGANADAHPALLRRAVAEGHEIGNHTQSHRDLSRLPAMQVTTDIQRTDEIVRSATGRRCTLLRPPYGATNATVAGVATSLGMPQILWDVDARDRDARAAEERAVRGARRGAVILMDDVQRSSADAVPRILDRLEREGYAFVTVSELFGGRSLRPGARYPVSS